MQNQKYAKDSPKANLFFSKRLFVAPEVSKNDQKWSKIYFKGHYKVGMKNYSQSA